MLLQRVLGLPCKAVYQNVRVHPSSSKVDIQLNIGQNGWTMDAAPCFCAHILHHHSTVIWDELDQRYFRHDVCVKLAGNGALRGSYCSIQRTGLHTRWEGRQLVSLLPCSFYYL